MTGGMAHLSTLPIELEVTLEGNPVNPIMRTNSQKNDLLAVGKSKEHPVTSIDTKTPHLFAFRLQLFGVE